MIIQNKTFLSNYNNFTKNTTLIKFLVLLFLLIIPMLIIWGIFQFNANNSNWIIPANGKFFLSNEQIILINKFDPEWTSHYISWKKPTNNIEQWLNVLNISSLNAWPSYLFNPIVLVFYFGVLIICFFVCLMLDIYKILNKDVYALLFGMWTSLLGLNLCILLDYSQWWSYIVCCVVIIGGFLILFFIINFIVNTIILKNNKLTSQYYEYQSHKFIQNNEAINKNKNEYKMKSNDLIILDDIKEDK